MEPDQEREKHKMSLLSTMHTSSQCTHVAVIGAAHVTGMNGLICEKRHPA